MKDNELKISPHIHGDWKVTDQIKIDVTVKDSMKPEYLLQEKTLFIGPLDQCQKFINENTHRPT